jgi:hypothetical protein
VYLSRYPAPSQTRRGGWAHYCFKRFRSSSRSFLGTDKRCNNLWGKKNCTKHKHKPRLVLLECSAFVSARSGANHSHWRASVPSLAQLATFGPPLKLGSSPLTSPHIPTGRLLNSHLVLLLRVSPPQVHNSDSQYPTTLGHRWFLASLSA